MQREIMTSTNPCRQCGQHLRLYLRTEGLDESGERYVAYHSEPIPHSRAECQRFQVLSAEQWPRLW